DLDTSAAGVDRPAAGNSVDAGRGQLLCEQAGRRFDDVNLRSELVPQPLQVAAVIAMVMGDRGKSDLGPLARGKIALEHPAVALHVLARVDRQYLVAADQVDRREQGVHRVVVRDLDSPDAGAYLHGVMI